MLSEIQPNPSTVQDSEQLSPVDVKEFPKDDFVLAMELPRRHHKRMPRIRVEAPPNALWEEVNAIDRAREEAAKREEESRRVLLAERERLQLRLDEIARMLSVLDRKPVIPTPQELLRPTKSIPMIIREILQLCPDGLTANEIEKRMGVAENRASLSLYTALHRMVKAGEVAFTGKRGERVYRLVLQKDLGKEGTTKGE